MARSNVPYVVYGQVYTASNYNQFVADNEAAHWKYTTAGDLQYATSSSELARLGIGNPGEVATVNQAGNAPEWKPDSSLIMALIFG
jgi:hypothetical protein